METVVSERERTDAAHEERLEVVSELRRGERGV